MSKILTPFSILVVFALVLSLVGMASLFSAPTEVSATTGGPDAYGYRFIDSNDPDEDPLNVPVGTVIDDQLDYGDAPAPYPTLQADNGACHHLGSIWMGAQVDWELDGQPPDLDDVNGVDDEDGVTFLGSSPSSGGPYTPPYFPGQYGAVQIVVGGATIPSCLHGWIDWNQDGTWANYPDLENIFTSYVVPGPGTYIIEFSIPATALAGQTWSRFRIDEYEYDYVPEGAPPAGGVPPVGGVPPCMNSPTGLALNGEVEDYIISVGPPDGWSSDGVGFEVDAYCEIEDVYATGGGFTADTDVAIYIFPDQAWSDGMPLDCAYQIDVFTTDGDGNLGPVLIWAAPLIPGEYDIVFDANWNSVYEELIDYVDHPAHPGFIIYECPEAGFTATPREGPAPLTVQFEDMSTGDITSWLWRFGDGETSREQHPSHIYNYPGTYIVTLTAEGPCGTDIATDYIGVFEEIEPARIVVRNLQIQPVQAYPGEEVTISADVVNQGGVRGSRDIELVINGQAEQSTRVGVDPGAAQHITFTTSKTAPGTYEVYIEGQASAFNVLLRPHVASTEADGGLGAGAVIAIVVIGVIFLVGMIIVFIFVRRSA